MFDNIAPSIHETNAQLKDLYRWLPPYNLGEGLTNLAMKDFKVTTTYAQMHTDRTGQTRSIQPTHKRISTPQRHITRTLH